MVAPVLCDAGNAASQSALRFHVMSLILADQWRDAVADGTVAVTSSQVPCALSPRAEKTGE